MLVLLFLLLPSGLHGSHLLHFAKLLKDNQDMELGEIGSVLRHPAAGSTVAACLAAFPALHMEAHLQPITRRALPSRARLCWPALPAG